MSLLQNSTTQSNSLKSTKKLKISKNKKFEVLEIQRDDFRTLTGGADLRREILDTSNCGR